MAKHAAAQLLDELMGRYRNAAPNEEKKEVRWEDPEFCKFYMVKFCPHDLFVNTRADLGACPKVHDDEAKTQFENSKSYVKSQYIDEFIKFVKNLLFDVEKKIVKGRQRLALIGQKTEPPSRLSQAQQTKNEDQISLLSEKINDLVKEAEKVGMEGNVEQAQGLMKLCDQLKDEREGLRKQNENSHWSQTAELAAAQEKQMEVCTICGAFLIVGDAQSRIDDHLMGKQHIGYSRLKAAAEELTEMRAKERETRSFGGDRFKRREGENGRLQSQDKDDSIRNKEKERSSSRVKESRPRSRDRGEGRSSSKVKESRPRSRDRGERERDRERKERSRDHDERHRRSEHRERSSSQRKHRSRSRDGKSRGRDERGDRVHKYSHHSSHRDRHNQQHRGQYNGGRY